MVYLDAFDTKISHFLAPDTFKTGLRHFLVAFKTSFRRGLDTVKTLDMF